MHPVTASRYSLSDNILMSSYRPGETQKSPDGIPSLLRSLGRSLEDARLKWEEREEAEAPRFQEFSFFTQREEAVSRVIAALISPWGLHGQGRIFLDLLMEQIGGDQLSKLQAAGTKVLSVNALMDEFVIAPKEQEWLETPLPAIQNRKPIQAMAEGKTRDLIVEFLRLGEGQPV